MVDFAHTTWPEIDKEMEGGLYNEGPDEGYIFGLRTIISLFDQLLEDHNKDATKITQK